MKSLNEYLAANSAAINSIVSDEIEDVCRLLESVISNDGIIWTAGNGGSASTASHAQCDLSKGVYNQTFFKSRVICLNDLSSLLSAWENDFGHQNAVANICETHIRAGDVLILVSGSGNSLNMVNAAMWANSKNIPVITLTGFDGGKLKVLATKSIHIGIDDMQVVENIHLLIIHYFLKFLIK